MSYGPDIPPEDMAVVDMSGPDLVAKFIRLRNERDRLTERLEAEQAQRDEWFDSTVAATREAARLTEQLEGGLALHARHGTSRGPYCLECVTSWPCSTARLLGAEPDPEDHPAVAFEVAPKDAGPQDGAT